MGTLPEYAAGEVIANKYVVEGPLGSSPCGRTFLAGAGLGSPGLVVKIYRKDLSDRLISAPDFFLKAGVAAEISVVCRRLGRARADLRGQPEAAPPSDSPVS